MVKVEIIIDEFAQNFYNLSDKELYNILENLRPMKLSMENQMRVYIESALVDLKELKEEIEKDMKWEC